MPVADDWRRRGQESDLPPGTTLVLQRYLARGATWEHEHCVLCWAKFIDPQFSESHRRFIDEHPDVLVEGYTTTDDHACGAAWHWVCPQCFEDFAEEFGWQRVDG